MSQTGTNTSRPLLSLKHLTKGFAGNTVLSGVSLTVQAGEFHGLIGENGAGKSTLINLLTGVHQPDSGTIEIRDRTFRGLTPTQAAQAGIHAVHQELSLSPHLTITENIFLGQELQGRTGLLQKAKMRTITKQLLADVGLSHLNPDTRVHRLALAERQLIEFSKATYQQPRVLILDEATSALDPDQVETMFQRLRSLRAAGMAVMFVSHRLPEMFELCERITVLKDGNQVVTRSIEGVDNNMLISYMTGREIVELFPPKPTVSDSQTRSEVMAVNALRTGRLNNISFSLYEGEILGLGGLQGQGQQELLGALFGISRVHSGSIRLFGQAVRIRNPRQAMKLGIAYLPEERKTEGLFLPHSIRFNLSFCNLRQLSGRLGTLRFTKEKHLVASQMKRLQVKAVDLNQRVGALSGGNQQKVVLSKWLVRNPKILLLNDPTRGIDIGTKREIYDLLREIASTGVSIVIVSSNTLELVGLCDRVLVLYEHHTNGVLEGPDLTEESLVRASVLR